MLPDRMVALATFTNPIEAELAKDRLLDEGISAHLLGDVGGNPFAGVSGLFGQMSLMVSKADADRASQVLAELPGRGDHRRDFLADAARAGGVEANEDSTAVKAPEWAAAHETAADDPETRYRAEDVGIQPAKSVEEGERIQADDWGSSPERVEGATDPKEEDEDDLNVVWKPDDYASRALKAAIFGPVVCGGILNLYSVYLLARLAFMDEDLSPAGMRKLYGALAINAIVLGALALFYLSLLR